MNLRSLSSRASTSLLLLALLGCPGDDGTAEGGADSGTASSTSEPATGSSTDPSPTSTSEPGTGSSTDPDPTSTSEPGDSSTGPFTPGCGDVSCSDAEWCDWSSNDCDPQGFGMATCEPEPEGCGDDYAPVCGCDGQVYPNECSANAAGVDVYDSEGCAPPEGYFRCGYRFCDPEFSYCQIQYSDIGGYGHSYACVSPKMECAGGITCDCLEGELCFESGCMETPDGGIEIGCPGG